MFSRLRKGEHLLERLRNNESLSSFEWIAAMKFASEGEEELLGFAYLVSAAKKGHLCVDIAPLFPPVSEIWPGEEALEEKIMAGLPKLKGPVVHEGKKVYLTRLHRAEKAFVLNFSRLIQATPRFSFSKEAIRRFLETTQLLPEQKEAVIASSQETVSVICGGPGTGKTHTAATLIEVLWQSLTEEERASAKVVLAAPTGKAAANLQGSMARARQKSPLFPELQAKTLHSLLSSRKKLDADIILVDESSMIDVEIMAELFTSVKEGAHLILIGDSYQLPSVEAGSLFQDLQALLIQLGKPVSELKRCLRTELTSIVELASLVHQGDEEGVLSYLSLAREGVVKRPFIDKRQAIDHILRHFPSQMPELSNEGISKFLKAYTLLTPMRRGPFGVEELNRRVLEELNLSFRPIMIVKNNPRLGLYNGDMGLLVEGKTVYVPGEKLREFPLILIPEYTYSYAVSVHKSQGSEYDHVALLVPEGTERFGRELLYTGITRAKKKIELIADDDVLKATIRRRSNRNSGVCK